ncbi:MAG TPA: type II toxin-antitoxin system VapC family toxin [Vicinamibacteria bacterium]|nr:type II toxin-antitoxin system VapC family toxin [Vicinamibacteria bacterium]
MHLVVDASALVEYLLGTSRGGLVRGAIETAADLIHAPALCDVEVASILRRAVMREGLAPHRAVDALIDLLDLDIERHGHLGLLGRIFALRENFSAYDATYVALAEELEAKLVTADALLIRSVRKHLDVPLIDASATALGR